MRMLSVLTLVALASCGAPKPSPNPGLVPHAEDHTLGPNAVFEVRVFSHEKLSQPYRVDVDGTIRFPMIGIVHVAGRTPGEIEEEIHPDATTVTRAAEGDARYVVAVDKIARAQAAPFYLRPDDTVFVPEPVFP